MKVLMFALATIFSACVVTAAEDSTSVTQKIGTTTISGFVDAYLAITNNTSSPSDIAFVTSPARNNEFAINLAIVDFSYSTDFVRTRFALQTGTYVELNYSAEPQGLRIIHAAVVGCKLSDSLWIDAGIMPSHIGMESALSNQNINYSRSLMADYSPYYETGIKLTYKPCSNLSLSALVLNGWQNIAETNSHKAFGSQVVWNPDTNITMNWSTFVGNEQPDGSPSQLRLFNDIYITYNINQIQLGASIDAGTQNSLQWYAAALQAKYSVTSSFAIAARAEIYADEHNIIVQTPNAEAFHVYGISANLDYTIVSGVLARLEGRIRNATTNIYTKQQLPANNQNLLVASIAYSF